MNRRRLFEIAEAHGLKLALDRLTTGEDRSGTGFHTYEFVPCRADADPVAAACLIRTERGVNRDFCTARMSDIDGQLYLEVSSFYFDPILARKYCEVCKGNKATPCDCDKQY